MLLFLCFVQKSDRRVIGYSLILKQFLDYYPGQSLDKWPKEIKWLCDLEDSAAVNQSVPVVPMTDTTASSDETMDQSIGLVNQMIPAAASTSPQPTSTSKSSSSVETRETRQLAPHLNKLMLLMGKDNNHLCHQFQSSDDDDPQDPTQAWSTSHMPQRTQLLEKMFDACDIAWQSEPHPGARPHLTRKTAFRQSSRSTGSKAKATAKLFTGLHTQLHWAINQQWLDLQHIDCDESQEGDDEGAADEEEEGDEEEKKSHRGGAYQQSKPVTRFQPTISFAAAAVSNPLVKAAIREHWGYV